MELTNQIILLGGFLLLLSIFASVISARVGAPLLLVFLLLGMLLGEQGPGGIVFDDVQTAYFIGSLALAIILFDGGLRTDASSFRVGLRPAVTLATLGVVVTSVVTGAVAMWLFNLNWLEALLIGAIVGSTDAAAVFSLLHSRGLQLKQRVGATLEIESGSNDPMAIFLTIVLVEMLVAGQTQLDFGLLSEFAVQMGLGAAFGLAGGWLLGQLVNRLRLNAGLYPLAAMAGGLLVFGATAVSGGSGFLAVYLAGLVLGNRPLQSGNNIRRFHDGLAWLSQITMFLMLGVLVTPSELLPIALQGIVLAAVLMLVARPLAVWLSLLPFRFPWRDQLFISWVGLRGAVPIILALFPLLAGLEQASGFFNIAFFIVLVSLLVQGWTVAPMARWLGLEVPPSGGLIQRIDLEIPEAREYEIVGYRVERGSQAATRPLDPALLPRGVLLAAVVRAGEPVATCGLTELEVGDYVYLVAPQPSLVRLDRHFATEQAPERLQERRFFGHFVLDGEAQLADLAMVYGFTLPEDAAATTLADYLARQCRCQAVVGDRIEVGRVTFVVREVDGGRITKVGLKLEGSGAAR